MSTPARSMTFSRCVCSKLDKPWLAWSSCWRWRSNASRNCCGAVAQSMAMGSLVSDRVVSSSPSLTASRAWRLRWLVLTLLPGPASPGDGASSPVRLQDAPPVACASTICRWHGSRTPVHCQSKEETMTTTRPVPADYQQAQLHLTGTSALLMKSGETDRDSDLFRDFTLLAQKSRKSLDDEARLREMEWALGLYFDDEL